MRSFHTVPTAAALFFATAAVLQAQNEPPPAAEGAATTAAPAAGQGILLEEEIVVTAHRGESERDQVGSAVTVIGHREIERRGKTTVLELLRTVPGLEVVQNGGSGTVASVFLRGANSNHTLVLIDGVRVNSATTGAFDFAALTSDDIERIEVLRGPQSTLYGSEAVGGVVSITTLHGRPGHRLAAAAEVGTRAFHRLRLNADGGASRYDYSVSLAGLETDGISAASERRGNSEADAYRNLTVAGRFGVAFPGGGRADLTVRRVDDDTGVDGFLFGVGPVDDPNATQERALLQTSLALSRRFTPRWRQTFTVGRSGDRILGHDPDTPFNNFDIASRTVDLGAQADVQVTDHDALMLGLAYEARDGESRGSYDRSESLASAFIENRWSWRDRLFLSAGLRHDDHSSFGSATTYRGTFALKLRGDATRLHGSLGTGFRAPSLNELFFPGAGNLALDAESSRGFDLGVERTFDGGEAIADLTFFANRFTDLIVFDLATFAFANVGDAESQGLEATLTVHPHERLELAAAYTYTDSEDLSLHRPLARRPRHRGSLSALFDATSRLRGAATVVVVADRIDADGSAMDDYARLDLTLDYQGGRRWRPYLRLENLLNEAYEEVNGFTSPGFVAVLGLRAER